MSANNRQRTFDMYYRHLLSETADLPSSMSPVQKKRLLRIKAALYSWQDFPMRTDYDMLGFIKNIFNVSQRTAYRDIHLVKKLIGTIVNTPRRWNDYRFNYMIEEAYAMAKAQGDTWAMAMLIDKFGKYNCLHIPEKEQIPWDEINPKRIVPTDDVSVLGIKHDPDIRLKAKELFEQYSADIASNKLPVYIQDIEPVNEFNRKRI